MYSINIKTNEKITEISESLYGLFFEDINRAGDGGLYAELLRNRAFDDGVIPQGCVYDSQNKLIISPTGWKSSFDCYEGEGIAAWTASGGAEMKLTDKNTLNKNRKRALEVNFNGGAIRNDGFMGVPVQNGNSYRFYMFAKAEKAAEVSVLLTSESGREYARHTFNICGGYTKYECELTSCGDDFNAGLTVTSSSSQTVTIGFTSLFPKDTYMGRENGLRRSLAERMISLKPSFLRFPGGCIVEGFTEETAFRFEDTIGPVWERKPHWLLWSYMTTNGLGFHEFLQFCEDAEIDAMYVFNCGMTCQCRNPEYFDQDLIEKYYNDTVHAILYATAPPDTEWGAKRAENGHTEPFTVLKYLEIGNENWGEEYIKRYEYFYSRLKKEFPNFTYISTVHTEHCGLKTEMVDEHFYSSPVFFAANSEMYDNLDRNSADIYCGEYAATIGCKEGILKGALGEAAFLTGIERNQDKVRMTSYAPLFQNVAYKAWEPDMIIFNNHEDYAIPGYYMLKMFAENRGDYVCKYRVTTQADSQTETGAFGIQLEKGISVSDIRLDSEPCGNIRVIEGTIDLTADNSFVGVGIGLAGDIAKNSQSLSAVIKSENKKIHIRFWYNGLIGEDQKYYDWICENGKSRVVHYNGWSCETICNYTECVLEEENKIQIITDKDEFEIILNGAVLHRKTIAKIPHITAVCTVDKKSGEVITKLVNFSENEITVNIRTDGKMHNSAEITTLTGDSYYAKNTFDDKEAVYPHSETVAASSDYNITIKPRSINVIRQKQIDQREDKQ